MRQARILIRKLQQADIQLANIIIEHEGLSQDNGLIRQYKNDLVKKINKKVLEIRVLSSDLNELLNTQITPIQNLPLQVGEAIEVTVDDISEDTLTFNYDGLDMKIKRPRSHNNNLFVGQIIDLVKVTSNKIQIAS